MKKNVFIIGSKGIPANYGGYETFVDELVSRNGSDDITYYVSCLNCKKDFIYKKANCFNVNVPNIGPAKAVLYDLLAFKKCLNYIKKNNLYNSIIYVLTCRIGPFFRILKMKAEKLGCKVYLNPDGHEWLRSKWPRIVKKYWKLSERLMVKYSDLIICDSLNIEKYILDKYKKFTPNTKYIAYGADFESHFSVHDKDLYIDWLKKYKLQSMCYYLIVGRFVPENNYETMIREFIASKSDKPLIIITNVKKNKFYNYLEKKYKFEEDGRIKFIGTVYNKNLLHLIRLNAFAYLHGHSVGGTNPSLLEALGATKINLLLGVPFNVECGCDSCFYWNTSKGNLMSLINNLENIDATSLRFKHDPRDVVKERYSWEFIVTKYESVFEEKN